MKKVTFALSAGFLMLVIAPLGAGDSKPLTADEIRAEYVDDITTAHELAAFADKFKSPEAYIAAASLLLKVEAQSKGKMGELPKEVTVIGADGKEKTERVGAAVKLSAQAMEWFDSARGVADASIAKEVEVLIKAAMKREYVDPADKDIKERGKAGGPANMRRTIKPNDTQVIKWTFKANQWAAVGMTSGSPLGIKIVGPNGGEMFSLRGARAVYRWMPKNDMTVNIRIHNGTNGPTTFNLTSN